MGTPQNTYDFLVKGIMLGDKAVGKSCLLLRAMDDSFTTSFITTIGRDFKVKIYENIEGAPARRIKAQLWDAPSQRQMNAGQAYRGVHIIYLVFDFTNRDSYEHIMRWARSINEHTSGDVSTVLIGAKCDRVGERVVSYREAKAFADTWGVPFFETSAKSSINVHEAFKAGVSAACKRLLPQLLLNPLIPPPAKQSWLGWMCSGCLAFLSWPFRKIYSFFARARGDRGPADNVTAQAGGQAGEDARQAEQNAALQRLLQEEKQQTAQEKFQLEKEARESKRECVEAKRQLERITRDRERECVEAKRQLERITRDRERECAEAKRQLERITRDRERECAEAKRQLEKVTRESKRDYEEVKKQLEKERAKKNSLNEDPPDEYCCSLSCDLMNDPVLVTATGQTYERTFIEEWFKAHTTDPLTRQELTFAQRNGLVVNYAIKNAIATWREAHHVEAGAAESPFAR